MSEYIRKYIENIYPSNKLTRARNDFKLKIKELSHNSKSVKVN